MNYTAMVYDMNGSQIQYNDNYMFPVREALEVLKYPFR